MIEWIPNTTGKKQLYSEMWTIMIVYDTNWIE